MLGKVEHIAIAVSDLQESIDLYTKVWGLTLEHREVVEDQGVEEAMFKLGDSYIQLLGPLGPETTVGKFVATRGPGLHHIAYEVDDIVQSLKELKEQGIRLIDESPRPGSRGTKIAFVHPKSNGGVLVELVEASK